MRISDWSSDVCSSDLPGAACDVPSTLYCFSFAPNPDWSRKYSTQPEILAYLKRTAEQNQIPQRVRFGIEVLNADFDAPTQRWQIGRESWRERVGQYVYISVVSDS